jgi:hypothetical protein
LLTGPRAVPYGDDKEPVLLALHMGWQRAMRDAIVILPDRLRPSRENAKIISRHHHPYGLRARTMECEAAIQAFEASMRYRLDGERCCSKATSLRRRSFIAVRW